MTLRLLFVSMHTSPASSPGAGDAGGMNVVELHQAEALAGQIGKQLLPIGVECFVVHMGMGIK